MYIIEFELFYQGPIGYAPVCQCLPVIKNIEKKVDVARESIYDHIDATHKILQNRMEQLDQRHMQQVCAVDKYSRDRLDAEELACHQRISNRFEEARENLLNQYHEELRTNVEEWLDEKMAVQGHCLNHHHDDSALPNNDVFTDIHENVQGRLFRTRSDETLSQSDNHSIRFRKKKFFESRQAAMQQIRGWQVPNYERRDQTNKNSKLPLAASTPDHMKKIKDRGSNRASPQINEHSNGEIGVFADSCDSKFQLGEQKDSGYSTKKDFFGPNGTCASSILRADPPSQYWGNPQTPACSQGARNVVALRHSTPKSKESKAVQMISLPRNQTNQVVDHWTAENEPQSFLRGGPMQPTSSSRLQGTGMAPQTFSTSAASSRQEDHNPDSPAFTTFGYPENVRTNSSLDPFTTPPKTCSIYDQSFRDRSRLYTSPASPEGQTPSNNSPRPKSFHGDIGINSYGSSYNGVPLSQNDVLNDHSQTRPTSMYSFSDNLTNFNVNQNCVKPETPPSSKGEYSTLGVRNPRENVYVTVNSVHSEMKENFPVLQTPFSMNHINSQQDFKSANVGVLPNLSKSETHLENGLQNSHRDNRQVLHESQPPFTKNAHGNVQGAVQQCIFVSKEDSSSNPDSGYSSKIYGNRPNSANPQSSMCTPSSSFSTDRSFSLQSCSPCNNVTGSQDSVTAVSRNHYTDDLPCERLEEKTEHEWYQHQLQEAAQKLTGGLSRNVSRTNPISPNISNNSGLIRNSQNWNTVPNYVRGSDV